MLTVKWNENKIKCCYKTIAQASELCIARCVVCIRYFPKVCVGLVLGHTIFYFIFSAVKCVGGGREQRCWMLNIVFRAPNIRSERQVLVAPTPAPAVTIWQWSNTRRLQSSPPAPSVSHSSGSDTERREERGEVCRRAGLASENAHLWLHVEYD